VVVSAEADDEDDDDDFYDAVDDDEKFNFKSTLFASSSESSATTHRSASHSSCVARFCVIWDLRIRFVSAYLRAQNILTLILGLSFGILPTFSLLRMAILRIFQRSL